MTRLLRSRRTRRAGVLSCALLAATVMVSPAAQAAAVTSLGGAAQVSGNKTMSVSCASVAGVTTSLSYVTFVMQVQGSAASSGAAVAVGIAVQCYVEDAATGATLGGVSGGLPGPVAEGVGTVTIPLFSDPYVCMGGTAVFSDGGSITLDPASNCAPAPPEFVQSYIDTAVQYRLRCPVGCPGP